MAANYKKEEILNVLYQDILQGVSKYVLLERLKNDYYNLGTDKCAHGSLQNYIRWAYEKCKIELQENRDKEKQLMYARYLYLYQECFANNDRYTAKGVLDSLTKLMGLNEAETVNLNTSGIDINVTFNSIQNKEEEDIENEEED